jgi:hypothetical protein
MRTIITVLFVLSLSGCGNDAGSAASGLIEVDRDTVPLEEVASDEWRGAPASCDGLLSSEAIDFLLASAEEELVAAVDQNGDIVCVDSITSVQDELAEQGDGEQATELGEQFLLAAGLAVYAIDDELAAGDPTPQPNTDDLTGAPAP